MSLLFEIMWMALLGLGVGVCSAGLGLGGGVLMMPVFITFIPSMDVHTAKGTSLFIILLVALTAFPRIWRAQQHHPHISVALSLSAGAVLGGYVSAYVTTRVSEDVILILFLLFVAFMMWRLVYGEPQPVIKRPVVHRNMLLFVIGLVAGAAGSATGTGGCSVFVPLILLTGLLPHTQTVYSANQVMIATSLAAAPAHFMAEQVYQGHFTIGHISLGIVPVIFIAAQVGIHFGVRINQRLHARRRRTVLAVMLAVVGLRMLLELFL